jgi:hypothetical protein
MADVTGNGYLEIIVTSNHRASGDTDLSMGAFLRTYVFERNCEDLRQELLRDIQLNIIAVADINGDFLTDVIIGASRYETESEIDAGNPSEGVLLAYTTVDPTGMPLVDEFSSIFLPVSGRIRGITQVDIDESAGIIKGSNRWSESMCVTFDGSILSVCP